MKKTTQAATHKRIVPDDSDQPPLRQTFVLTNRNGLHARPCALLVKTLRPFACDVRVEHDGATASGDSILNLMALAAGFESKLTFIVTGGEAVRALLAVQRLFETGFEEAYAPKTKVTPCEDNSATGKDS